MITVDAWWKKFSCVENPHGPRSLEGYSPWGDKESDTMEQLSTLRYANHCKVAGLFFFFLLTALLWLIFLWEIIFIWFKIQRVNTVVQKTSLPPSRSPGNMTPSLKAAIILSCNWFRVEKPWHLRPPMSRCKETVPFIILFFYVLAASLSMQDLSSSTRNQTHLSPAVQA